MKDAIRSDTRLRRALLTGHLRDTWFGILLLIAILCLAGGMLTVQIQQNQRTLRDLRGASPRTGTAIVTGITSRPVSRHHPDPEISIYLTIDSRPARVTARRAARIGESFQATYRIGQSGTVYVDNLEPLPANRQAIAP
jgi:hypothetical protein